MKNTLRTTFTAALLLAAITAQAQVTVKDAWVRATIAQQKATGAFMQLEAAKDSKLIGVSTPLTPVAEVHEMALQDNVMRMRQVPSIALRAGQTVALKPGGFHVMLMDLKQQVKEGDTVPLTLHIESADGKRETVEVQAPVRALNSSAKPAAGHAGHGGHNGHKH